MSSPLINYSLPSITERERDKVNEVLKTTSITQGAFLKDFEHQLAGYCGVDYAIAVSSGSAALHLAYKAAGLKDGGEATLPAITFASAAAGVMHCGGTPVILDTNPDGCSYSIDQLADHLEQSYNQTALLVTASIGGYPFNRKRIYELAAERDIPVIADLSHALGAFYKTEQGRMSPVTDCRYELASVVSFQALKNITTGEGGAVLTNDKALAQNVRLLCNHGIESACDPDEPWRYDIIEPGYNYRITEKQCAMGIAQLERLPDLQERRNRLANRYLEAFSPHQQIKLPLVQADHQNSWHLFVIRIPERKKLYDKLLQAGYKAQVHYVPLHYLSFLRRAGRVPQTPEASEIYYRECLSLPLFPEMRDEDQEAIIWVVEQHIAGL